MWAASPTFAAAGRGCGHHQLEPGECSYQIVVSAVIAGPPCRPSFQKSVVRDLCVSEGIGKSYLDKAYCGESDHGKGLTGDEKDLFIGLDLFQPVNSVAKCQRK